MSRSFSDVALVACGTMKPELKALTEQGWLDAGKILYTPPGLHQDPEALESALVRQVARAREAGFDKVIVVFGGKFCYVNANQPDRTMGSVIDDLGPGVVRLQAHHCMDMLATDEEQRALAPPGAKVWWMTPGWVKHRSEVFQGWDKARANENFPQHEDGAYVLDGIGFLDQYMADKPEEFLEYCDWMGIPMYGAPVKLDRFKGLLVEALDAVSGS